MNEQQRNYSRVETFFSGRLRILAPGETYSLYHGCPGCETDQPPGGRVKGVNLPEPLLDFLETINTKLDMLLSIANQEHLQNSFPVAINIVEISGAGLVFFADHDFSPGEEVEMVLFLSRFPLQIVGVMGRLHRHEERHGKIFWAVDFTAIREHEREAVVRFVFQQQREQIRERKQWD